MGAPLARYGGRGAASARRRQRSGRIESHAAEILGLIAGKVDITLAEIAEHLQRAHGLRFAPSTIWRFLDRHAQTFKKTAHASEQERPDVASERQTWRAAQPDLDAARLVFIDVTGTSTKMARLYGRSQRGVRCTPRSRTATGRRRPSSAA